MTDITVIRHDIAKLEPQFAAALPSHIPAERFGRVVMTAIQNSPALMQCSRQSLWNACMKAAQDGLLPDGREGAIVSYKGRATWIPMVAGLRKRARNSGEISDWRVEVVRLEDEFDYVLGDKPSLWHKPKLGSTSEIIAAYSVCQLKDGTISREVMSIEEVEAIRKAYVRSQSGPWNDPVAYPEMVKKTVARRHAKQLPTSADLDDLLRRDDELYDLNANKEPEQQLPPRKPRTVADQFAEFAGEEIGDGEAPDKSREETPNDVSHREHPPSSATD